jgi:transposase
MTAKKQVGATPRRFDEAFKWEAVRLWKTSGRSAEAVAGELGISVFNLYKWGQEGGPARAAGPVRPPESKEELQLEVERLSRELERVTEQRDILKKAAGILSEPSPRGMPGSKR